MKNLTMFDSVNVNNIPPGAQLVAGYVNGLWPTFHEVQKRFPHIHHVSITVNSSGVADVLDVEKGDATAAEAVAWVKLMRTKYRRTPTIYTSATNMESIIADFHAQSETPPYFWIADWTGQPHLYPGSVATQWADGTATYPGLAPGCDTSLVSPDFPGLKTKAVITVTPTKKGNKVTIPTPNLATLKSWVRQLGSIAGIVVSLGNQMHLPAAQRAVLLAGSLWIQREQHLIDTTVDPTVPAAPVPPTPGA